MLKKAKQIMKEQGYDFIATGEVLGQRPFSQSRQSLELIEKRAGLKGLVIRPLSDKLLKETKFGKDGFYDFSGKDRKRQIELAKKYNIKNIPMPAGGCILTDINFSNKLRELLKIKKNFNGDDIQMLKLGRTFFNESFFVIVSRNEKEGKELKKNKKRGDIVLEPNNFAGPTVLIRKTKKSSREEMINFGSDLVIKFSKNVPDNPILLFL
jgi:tRNA U34 2-thiouridine synthase MnmA/TrmU